MLAAGDARSPRPLRIAMRPSYSRLRTLLTTALLVLVPAAGAHAQENRLPDIGSSAGSVLGPVQQPAYARLMLARLRHYGDVREDPAPQPALRSPRSGLA